jgi:uroporphyrinogen decarboxylase
MTGKDRMKMAFANVGEPDRVPFEPGLDFDTFPCLSGLDYWAYQDQGTTDIGSLITWCDRLGFDLYHYAAGIPEPHPPSGVRVSQRKSEEPEVRIEETNVVAVAGTIQQRRRQPRRGPAFAHEKFVKDLSHDWPVLREYWGEDWPVDPRYFEEYARIGDRGVCGMVVHSPIDWWQEYRHGGIEQVIYDLYDEPELMRAVFAFYRERSLAYLEKAALLIPPPDFVMIHGSCCSASVMTRDFFVQHALPYIQEAAALLRKQAIPSLFHVCGKSRQWMDYLADTDLNVVDALECPPTGNVDLAEVKRRFGARLCLKGNISALKVACGTPAEVRDEVKRCIDAAAAGGGFVLCVGDSIGPRTTRENVETMVSTALEYGKY